MLPKKIIIKIQSAKLQLLSKLTQDLTYSTQSLELLDTNFIHEIINSEKDTVFVVAGGTHCKNLAEPLEKLGYKRVKKTERTFTNNPLPRPVLGYDSQCIPVNIKEHFGNTSDEHLESTWKKPLVITGAVVAIIGTVVVASYAIKRFRKWLKSKRQKSRNAASSDEITKK